MIEQEAQKASTSALVELYQLDATALGGSISYFCSTAIQNSPISFDRKLYMPIPIAVKGFEVSGNGPFPRPSVSVSNIVFTLLASVLQMDDLIGAKFTRVRTFAKYLDGSPESDPTQYFPPEIYYVARKSLQNSIQIDFELRSIVDQENRQLPSRIATKSTCPWIYRRWDPSANDWVVFDLIDGGCPYRGEPTYNERDERVFDPAQDKCSKRLGSCRLRFGITNRIPYGAFPGIQR